MYSTLCLTRPPAGKGVRPSAAVASGVCVLPG